MNYTPELLMEVLRAYINHVGECEGISFLSEQHKKHFKPEHWEILQIAKNPPTFEATLGFKKYRYYMDKDGNGKIGFLPK
jgi:hypothetical protein